MTSCRPAVQLPTTRVPMPATATTYHIMGEPTTYQPNASGADLNVAASEDDAEANMRAPFCDDGSADETERLFPGKRDAVDVSKHLLVRKFLDERCSPMSGSKVSTVDMYDAFINFYNDYVDNKPFDGEFDMASFGQAVKQSGMYHIKRESGGDYWMDVQVNTPDWQVIDQANKKAVWY